MDRTHASLVRVNDFLQGHEGGLPETTTITVPAKFVGFILEKLRGNYATGNNQNAKNLRDVDELLTMPEFKGDRNVNITQHTYFNNATLDVMTFLRDDRIVNGPPNLKNASQSLLNALRDDAMASYDGGVKYQRAWDIALREFNPVITVPAKFVGFILERLKDNYTTGNNKNAENLRAVNELLTITRFQSPGSVTITRHTYFNNATLDVMTF